MSRYKKFPEQLTIGIIGTGEFIIMPKTIESSFLATHDIRKIASYHLANSDKATCSQTLTRKRHRRSKAQIEAERATEGQNKEQTQQEGKPNKENEPEKATEAKKPILYRCLNPLCNSKEAFANPLSTIIENGKPRWQCPNCRRWDVIENPE